MDAQKGCPKGAPIFMPKIARSCFWQKEDSDQEVIYYKSCSAILPKFVPTLDHRVARLATFFFAPFGRALSS